MKHKTLFRLMLKAVGVFFFAEGISAFATSLPRIIYLIRSSGLVIPVTWQFSVGLLGPLIKMGIGLYLFFGGKWLADKAIPSNRPYCHECGYDLTGATRPRCPECDTPFQPEDVRPPIA